MVPHRFRYYSYWILCFIWIIGERLEKIELKAGSTSEIETGFKWHYNSDMDYNLVLIDEQNIKSVSIDTETIIINQ